VPSSTRADTAPAVKPRVSAAERKRKSTSKPDGASADDIERATKAGRSSGSSSNGPLKLIGSGPGFVPGWLYPLLETDDDVAVGLPVFGKWLAAAGKHWYSAKITNIQRVNSGGRRAGAGGKSKAASLVEYTLTYDDASDDGSFATEKFVGLRYIRKFVSNEEHAAIIAAAKAAKACASLPVLHQDASLVPHAGPSLQVGLEDQVPVDGGGDAGEVDSAGVLGHSNAAAGIVDEDADNNFGSDGDGEDETGGEANVGTRATRVDFIASVLKAEQERAFELQIMRSKRSPVWLAFVKPDKHDTVSCRGSKKSDDAKQYAKCRGCGAEVAMSGNTTNFWAHVLAPTTDRPDGCVAAATLIAMVGSQLPVCLGSNFLLHDLVTRVSDSRRVVLALARHLELWR
jgi:hypothetical protein